MQHTNVVLKKHRMSSTFPSFRLTTMFGRYMYIYAGIGNSTTYTICSTVQCSLYSMLTLLCRGDVARVSATSLRTFVSRLNMYSMLFTLIHVVYSASCHIVGWKQS